jgi:hypothetical protein
MLLDSMHATKKRRHGTPYALASCVAVLTHLHTLIEGT